MKKITKGITALWTEVSLVFLYLATFSYDPTPTKAIFVQIAPGIITAMQVVAAAFLAANVIDNGVQGRYYNAGLAQQQYAAINKEDL